MRGGERPPASIWLYLIDSAMFVDVSVFGVFLLNLLIPKTIGKSEERREKRYRERENKKNTY